MLTIPKFKINDIAEVVKKEFGHGFNIGDQVLIVEINYDKDGRIEDYKCLLGKEDWFLRGEELKPITLSPQLATDGREELEKENHSYKISVLAGLRREGYLNDQITALQSSLKEKEKRIAELEKVLTGLVNLKELKDTEGKTEIYLQLQPIAWKQAKELLNK